MLYLVLSYFLGSCICLWTGITIYSYLPPDNKARTRPVIYYFITGLIGLTAFGQWIVLYSPLNFISLTSVLVMVTIAAFFRRKSIAQIFLDIQASVKYLNGLGMLVLLCFLVMILTLNAGPTMMDDTDSYHIQMVKWIHEYGTVPGIANLHLRFGFNSSWFIAAGLLFPRIDGINQYLILNGMLSAWLSYYLIEKISGSFANKGGYHFPFTMAALIVLLFCLLDWPMIRGNACSMNYDFISTTCVIVLFIEAIYDHDDPSFEWLFWPTFLITIRLIHFPLILLGVYYCLKAWKSGLYRKLGFSLVFICIVAFPFIIRNLLLTGYPLFPFYQLDPFSFDWKVDRERTVEIVRYIKYFNRVNPMFQPLSKTTQLGFPVWLFSWYKYLFPIDKLLTSLSLISYAMVFIFKRKILSQVSTAAKFFFYTMICQLLCWIFIAPDPRFVYGPLIFSIFLLVKYIMRSPKIQISHMVLKSSLISMACFVLAYAVLKMSHSQYYRNWIAPRALPIPPVRNIMVGAIELHIPEKILDNWNPRCYDIALPCLYRPNPRLEARGKTIAEGFRISGKENASPTGGEYKINE